MHTRTHKPDMMLINCHIFGFVVTAMIAGKELEVFGFSPVLLVHVVSHCLRGHHFRQFLLRDGVQIRHVSSPSETLLPVNLSSWRGIDTYQYRRIIGIDGALGSQNVC